MTFLKNLKNSMNETTTENGAKTFISTQSPLLDFFALGGATRKNPELGLDLFKKALAEDNVKAIRILFYLRDIRGGQGERNLFRDCIKYIANEYPDIFKNIVNIVPEYGRYDDLMVTLGTKSEEVLAEALKDQLLKDFQSETPSLLGKWMPSENATSAVTVSNAKKMIKLLDTNPKEYRKMLSRLRKQIKIVETNLTTGEYKTIEYDKLPSQAGMKYTKAFKKKDGDRYNAYVLAVKGGEKKINTSTLYPYQIYEAVNRGDSTDILDVMWTNLKDYTGGKNALVVADVSGSMSGQPMSVSVSLALYFADKNTGPWKDHFITFSSEPRLQEIKGANIREKMNSIERADWSMSTNLLKVFSTVLNTATQNKVTEDEMPKTLYIISDMEFDAATGGGTNFEAIRQMYANHGYTLPSLVFWNVNARNKQVPVTKDERGVTLVSGFSSSTFSLVVENKSPIQLMEDVINGERYCKILA